ncbi:MAG: cation diffusion facilitator family transporter [Clostridia bacterium]
MNREKNIKNAGILGIVGNLFLLIIKGTVGFITHSQAMIADAANSAGDIFASLMTFIGNKIASAPQDDDHNFGHGKAEYIFSLFISLSMIGISLKLLYNSLISLIYGYKFDFSWFLVIVCVVTILVKLCLFLYTKFLSHKFNSILLDANKEDHRNDCIVTTFTLISVLLGLLNIYWFDGIVGIFISAWICITGVKIFIESYNILIDTSIDVTTQEVILNLTTKYEEIKKVDNISSSPVGYKYIVFVTICVDGNMTTFNSHKLADKLEKDICELDKVYRAIVHVNPI